MYDFDNIIERNGTNSVKWDALKERYGREDLLPLWIADMDFSVPTSISAALEKRAKHDIYGYTYCSDEYYESIIGWMKRRHNWDIEKEWIISTSGVVPALSLAIKAFANPGDKVIVQSPVYHPFYDVIRNNGCHVVNNPLIYEDGKYVMDYEDLEEKIDSRTRLLFLCNPHNPVGRVWTKDELHRLGEICLKNDVIIISDEIHFDLVYKDYDHNVLANTSPEIKDICIVCTAPGKTFNIAGLQTSNIIIPNEKLRRRYNIEFENSRISGPNIFGIEALIAAYNDSEYWLDALLVYLEGNRDYFINFVEERIPQLKVVKPEGTYLAWVDCSGLNMNPEQLRDFFVNKCRLALNDGGMFGEEGQVFQRFNMGCPRSILEESLRRIGEGVKSL